MANSKDDQGSSIFDELKQLSEGELIGVSDWLTVDQEMIDGFAKHTLDPDPMHIDPEWCKKNSPFGTTVAFGFLTVSLLTHFLHDVLHFNQSDNAAGGGYGINYGFDRLRLVAPVPVNSRIRGTFTMKNIREKNPGEMIQTVDCTIEIEGQERPALVAEWVSLGVSEQGHERISANQR